jgi:hypothetical protein
LATVSSRVARPRLTTVETATPTLGDRHKVEALIGRGADAYGEQLGTPAQHEERDQQHDGRDLHPPR